MIPHKIIWKIVILIVLMVVSCSGYTELSSMVSTDDDIVNILGAVGFLGIGLVWVYTIFFFFRRN